MASDGKFHNVPGVGVIDVPELMRQLEMEKQQSHARAEYILRQKQTIDDLRRTLVAMDSGWTPPPHVPPQQAEFVQAALEELNHARAKHGDGCIDGEQWSDTQRLAILLEEVGEVASELNDEALSPGVRKGTTWSDGSTDTVEGGHLGRLLGELIQVAAMAIGWGARVMPGPAAELPAEGQKLSAGHVEAEAVIPGRRVGVETFTYQTEELPVPGSER